MTKLELLELFFDAWTQAQSVDKRSIEGRAALEQIELRAQAVRDFKPTQAPDTPPISVVAAPGIADFRALQHQINEIEPKKPTAAEPYKNVSVVSG